MNKLLARLDVWHAKHQAFLSFAIIILVLVGYGVMIWILDPLNHPIITDDTHFGVSSTND